jgi:type II restriction/modification system DNA methylase subunit YeeA
MDTSKLKSFAPQARVRLQEQIGAKLDYVLRGDSAELRGKSGQVESIRKATETEGRTQYIERIAYTWFNRLSALRFIDARGYHPFGCRVITPEPGNTQPEILQLARNGALPPEIPADLTRINDLLDGRIPSSNPQAEVYRHLVLAVCAHYHKLLPFLFEKLDSETELLLPDDLLTPASVAEGFRTEISDEDCADVEIIGWLYQFYISEKKDEVIGKVVKSEDIPAATQLFTPNWIVKYMVQNSLGAQWLATYPQSPLKGQMEYYIEPAEQTDAVNAQIKAITPSQLNPEELTLIDPASGSGHILVEAYELFKAIYLERGYRQRDVPQLILEKNLFGLDIDERAAQLTGFALMMKGRADDRRLFERGVKLNVIALVDSAGFDAEALARGVELADYDLRPGDLTELKDLFEYATTFGSLIQVPAGLAEKLPALKQLSEATSQDLFVSEALKRLGPLVQQAELLAAQYDAVVANPPYMGGKFQTPVLKKYLKDHFKGYEKDFFSAFIDRNLSLSRPHGRLGLMSPFVWMFISSYDYLRTRVIDEETITSLIQLEYSGFEGATVPICTFTLKKGHLCGQKGSYIRLSEFRGSANQGPRTLEAIRNRDCGWCFEAAQDEFKKIPGSPLAYWVSERVFQLVEESQRLGDIGVGRMGLATGNNDRFVRIWHECGHSNIGLGYPDRMSATASGLRWFPYAKGGQYRKWYGNNEHVVDWFEDGNEIRTTLHPSGKRIWAHNFNLDHIFQSSVTWALITSGSFSVRFNPPGFLFDGTGACGFFETDRQLEVSLGLLNTKFVGNFSKVLNPTLAFQAGDFENIPYREEIASKAFRENVSRLVEMSMFDWDAYERSWDFQSLPLLTASSEPTPTLESSYTAWITENKDTIAEMKRLEEENNRLFIDAYGLADELTPDVPIEQITLTVNPAYRYGGKLTEEEQWTRFRQDTMEELVSYAIGCMMGRYSLDAPGLILADFRENPEAHKTAYTEKVGKTMETLKFQPDDDGIIPVLDDEWFEDDVVARFRVFLRAAFGNESLEENLRFLEEAIGKKIRKYFVNDFYKAHLQTYKKRPIYWLFQSPKKSFQALVYLHRYDRDTVNRLLNDYLRPYQDKLRNRQDHLDSMLASEATSNRDRNAATKEKEKNAQALTELADWERDVIYPLATQRIEIDLDDGVKQNYPKFGKALAKVPGLS